MLKAAKDSDVAAFKNAYSKEIREDKGQRDWEKNLKDAQVNMNKLFGDYQLDDFSFTFAGDSGKGRSAAEPGAAPDRGRIMASRDVELLHRIRRLSLVVRQISDVDADRAPGWSSRDVTASASRSLI